MTTGGGRASSLQLALLTAMFSNVLCSRVGGTSIFWRSSVEIPIWFLVLICIILVMVGIYVVKEIKGLKAAIYSWRDLCNDMESDDREVRRAAIRILQRLEDRGLEREPEVQIRADVLHDHCRSHEADLEGEHNLPRCLRPAGLKGQGED